MDIFAISLAVVSGLCLGTGLLHLFIGLRRRGTDMKHLTFALFALAYAGAVLFGLLMYRSTSLSQYLVVDRWSGVFAGLTYIFLVWFVAIYTGEQPLPFLAALTLLFATLIAAHVTRPTLIHGQIIGLASATLPWGEQLTFLEAAESAWELVFLVTQLLTIGFLFFACLRQYRRGERGAALALGAGLLLFVCTLVVDVLVESGVVDFVLASDFGFLPLAIVMSLQMSNAVLRTEEELAHYRRQLEVLVDERTTELKGANEQLAQANEELATLNSIAQTLSTVTDLPAALERVSEMLMRLFAASHTFVVLPTGEGDELQILAGYGRASGPIEVTPLPVLLKETSYARQVLIEGESLSLSDVQSLPLIGPVSELLTTQSIFSMALVPLVVRGDAMGFLFVASDQTDRVFTPDEVRLAETVAAEIAGAIESARLFEQAQASAVGEERARIARDLHDSVTQTIYSASLIAEALLRVWERDPEQVKGNLNTLLLLIGALAEMRTLLFELRPAALEEASLDRLLHQLADVLTGRTRTPVEVTVQGQSDLPAVVKVALYRIAQEALNNVAKHAGATQVTVALQNLPDRVLLTIQDDGRGFYSDSVAPERMGVRIMHERAMSIGAVLVVASAPRQGTRVQVECPAEKEFPMSETNPIRVLLVDDHAMVRSGLRLFLSSHDDLEIVAEAGDGQEAIDLCSQVQPDVILMDIVMPGVDGPTATARIRQAFPQIQVIALTSFLEEDLVQEALKAGAISYLLKDVGADRLAEAIRAAYRGRGTIDSAAAQILVQAASKPPPLGRDLTARERDILALLVKGLTNKEIAQRLGLSPGTVRIYVSNILSKLGASNRTEAATLALQNNLIDKRR